MHLPPLQPYRSAACGGRGGVPDPLPTKARGVQKLYICGEQVPVEQWGAKPSVLFVEEVHQTGEVLQFFVIILGGGRARGGGQETTCFYHFYGSFTTCAEPGAMLSDGLHQLSVRPLLAEHLKLLLLKVPSRRLHLPADQIPAALFGGGRVPRTVQSGQGVPLLLLVAHRLLSSLHLSPSEEALSWVQVRTQETETEQSSNSSLMSAISSSDAEAKLQALFLKKRIHQNWQRGESSLVYSV